MDSAEAMMARFLARLSLRSELDPADQQAILGLPGLAERYAANQDIIMPGEHVTVRLTLAGELIYEDGARPSASRSWSCPAISPALRSPAGRSATGSRPTPGRTSSAR